MLDLAQKAGMDTLPSLDETPHVVV